MRFSALLAVLVAAPLAAAGCDFSPTLDIETPVYRPALALTTVLFADSTARIRVTESRDPYALRPNSTTRYSVLQTATVTLARDGGPPETLSFKSRPCTVLTNPPPGFEERNECGAYASATSLQAGATYTVRAQAPGLPPVEATATIPARVSLTATKEPGTRTRDRDTERITLRFRDAPGPGQRYSLDALLGGEVSRGQVCSRTPPVVCRDTTYTSPFFNKTSFTTQDPVLVVGLRGVPGTTNTVTFTDDLFDGEDRSFTIEADVYGRGRDEVRPARRIVRLFSLSEPLYQAYQQAFYSFGEGNPFQEPFDLPSNVRGGYGLVGAASVAEVVFAP